MEDALKCNSVTFKVGVPLFIPNFVVDTIEVHPKLCKDKTKERLICIMKNECVACDMGLKLI